ncbi:MAG: hypothetical protein BGN92_08670 [Sphingobacteriales bacterium 41-5]|nr:MAG: hypothetical protein BGN92_08670 [Sphingobacteriales bacterium 41-5]
MNQGKPQFIKDTAGKQLVILSKKEYDAIIDELEEAEDVRLYDDAKKNDSGERILFTDYLKQRQEK